MWSNVIIVFVFQFIWAIYSRYNRSSYSRITMTVQLTKTLQKGTSAGIRLTNMDCSFYLFNAPGWKRQQLTKWEYKLQQQTKCVQLEQPILNQQRNSLNNSLWYEQNNYNIVTVLNMWSILYFRNRITIIYGRSSIRDNWHVNINAVTWYAQCALLTIYLCIYVCVCLKHPT